MKTQFKKNWLAILRPATVKELKTSQKLSPYKVIMYLLISGAPAIILGLARYFLQLIALATLPSIDYNYNSFIIQIASPFATACLLSGSMVMSAIIGSLVKAHANNDVKKASEVLYSGFLYVLIILVLFSLFFLFLVRPIINVEQSKLSSSVTTAIVNYIYILYFSMVCNSFFSYLICFFVVKGKIYQQFLLLMISFVVSLVFVFLLASPHIFNAKVYAIPLGLLINTGLSVLLLLSAIIIENRRTVSDLSFRNGNFWMYFRRKLIPFFSVISIAASCRYIFQMLVAFFFTGLFFHYLPLLANSTSPPEDHFNGIYWTTVFSSFYQIFLLFLMGSFGIGQGSRVVLGLVSGNKHPRWYTKQYWLTIKVMVTYYVFVTLLILLLGPFILKTTSGDHGSVINYDNHTVTLNNFFHDADSLFYICGASILLSCMQYHMNITAQLTAQPKYITIAASLKNIIIIVFGAILLPVSIATKNYIFFFLSWPISDLVVFVVTILFISAHFKIVHGTGEIFNKITRANLKKCLHHKTSPAYYQ